MLFYIPIQFKKSHPLTEKEISKGPLGFVTRYSNKTVFTFFKTNIEKRKKLIEEMNAIINSYKEHKINEGILKIKSINNNNTSFTIITEPVIDSLSNFHNTKLKGFEIFKIFDKFNVFIEYCFNKKINLSNLKLSDIYLTENHDIKLLTLYYDTEIINKIKKEKLNATHNNNANSMLYTIGTIIYYLYYNEYPKKNETKFPEQKHFQELLKYCLNPSTKFDYNEYINHTFFHPDIIFPNINKENIKLFDKYIEYKPSNASIMSPVCKELNDVSGENIYKIIQFKRGGGIYHKFFEEEMIEINDTIESITKKIDGTYLLGGSKNHIYQVYFNKYGCAEVVSEVDTGYGYYEDDLKEDCIYSYSSSRYYGVGYVEECENGDIIPYSDLKKIKKFWRYKN